MRASSPSRVGGGDPACRGRGHRYDFKAEPIDHAGHFFIDVAPGCDDQGLRHRSGGNHNLGLGFQNPYAGIGFLFSERNRHQCRGIDGNHRGKPSGRKRKSWLLAALSPVRALAAPEDLIASRSFLRAPGATTASNGTKRATAWPCLVSTTSSPASARRISSVNWPLALVTATLIAHQLPNRAMGNMDQSMVHVKPAKIRSRERKQGGRFLSHEIGDQRGSSRNVVGRTSSRTIACA